MATILSLEFLFRGNVYHALVRIKPKSSYIEHYITIMNGDLERLLYGEHIIIEKNGQLDIDQNPTTDAGKLRLAIATSLLQHYKEAGAAMTRV